MNDDAIKRLREALAAGPTPIDPDLYGGRYISDDYSRCDLTKEQDAFVRAASPDNIDALLDENDRLWAENDALWEDARRYRWLRGEHQRIDPICAVVWKRNGDRNGSEWVNTADLDAAIDAAMPSASPPECTPARPAT